MVGLQYRSMLIMANKQEIVGTYGLSNGAIFNDLERSISDISKSRRYLTLNIS